MPPFLKPPIQQIEESQLPTLWGSASGQGSANRCLPIPLGHGVCETKSKNGRSRHGSSFMHRVYSARRGVETMVARPWGRVATPATNYRGLSRPSGPSVPEVSPRVSPKAVVSQGVSHGMFPGPLGRVSPECPKIVRRVSPECPGHFLVTLGTLSGHFLLDTLEPRARRPQEHPVGHSLGLPRFRAKCTCTRVFTKFHTIILGKYSLSEREQ